MDYRTDLAIEKAEIKAGDNGKFRKLEGVAIENHDYGDGIKSTVIDILDKNGMDTLKKPIGRYITIEAKSVIDESEVAKNNAINALYKELSKMIVFNETLKVMIVGLGNINVTPDSLGPKTVSKIKATKHVFDYFELVGDNEMSSACCIIPGVVSTTGIETADYVKKISELVKPDIMIVIDSLAAKNINRVSTTIQVTDTGIAPGSGMGNHRKGINENNLGFKVISIGVPTVIDAATIIRDTMTDTNHSDDEIDEYIVEQGNEMIVTSTDIDMIIEEFSDILAYAVNKVIHPGIYSI